MYRRSHIETGKKGRDAKRIALYSHAAVAENLEGYKHFKTPSL